MTMRMAILIGILIITVGIVVGLRSATEMESIVALAVILGLIATMWLAVGWIKRLDRDRRGLGKVLVVLGLLAVGYFFFVFDPSVPSESGGRINNLGLMKDQQNGIIVGFGVAAVGGILMFLKAAGIAADEKQCPNCAETIKAAARVCRYCQKELGA